MKYVIVRNRANGLIHPLVFDDGLIHCDVVPSGEVWEVVSAGFCRKTDLNEWVTYGISDSLKSVPTPMDALILCLFLTEGFSGLDLLNLLTMRQLQEEKCPI